MPLGSSYILDRRIGVRLELKGFLKSVVDFPSLPEPPIFDTYGSEQIQTSTAPTPTLKHVICSFYLKATSDYCYFLYLLFFKSVTF